MAQALVWAPPSFLTTYFHACYYLLCLILLSFSLFACICSPLHVDCYSFFFILLVFFLHVIVLFFVCYFLFCTWCYSPLHASCCFLFCARILHFFTRIVGIFFAWVFSAFFFICCCFLICLHIVALLFAFLPYVVISWRSLYYPPTIPSCRLGVIKSWEPNELFF